VGLKLQREQRFRRRRDDEGGAELVEFALIVVLLVALLYGIISYGLVFAFKNGSNSAADDAARAALSAYNFDMTAGDTTTVAQAAAQTAATNAVNRDLSWLGSTTCSSSAPTAAAPKQCTSVIGSSSSGPTFTETVTYDYSGAPLVPILPGLNVITPTTITSTDTVLLTNV
jgi:Flp pilus assembly protein TadG